MRESIGNALLFNIALVIIGTVLILLVASFSYSKAFKAKNMIINTIEKYYGFPEEAANDVNENLRALGYQLNNSYDACKQKSDADLLYGDVIGDYHYCVYEKTISRGKYYLVTTYMHLDAPILKNIAIPVNGESRLLYQGIEG